MRNFFIKLIILLSTTFVLSSSFTFASTHIEDISKIVQYRLDVEKSTLGAAIVIIEGNNIEFINFGTARKDKNQAITKDTLFEIGSISKTFTSIALASMVDEGKVKLHDPVQMYMPENVRIPIKTNDNPITLASLANHSSGLPRLPINMPYGDPLDPYADYTVEMMYEFLNNYDLPREVGENYEYSNLAVGLLGHVLGLIDKKTYQEVIDDRVLKPLLMTTTFVNVPMTQIDNLSDGHNGALNKTKHWQLPTLAGAGGLKSNAKDMALFLAANMQKQSLTNAIALTHKQSINYKDAGPVIGLAWHKKQYGNGSYLHHNGGTGGFRTFIGFDQKQKKGIVILDNSANGLAEIGDAYLTNSLKDINPDIENTIVVKEAKLKRLIGQYELVPGFILTVSNIENQLYIQATGQHKLPVFPKSDLIFEYRAVKASVIFELGDNNTAVSVSLDQGGKIQKAVRLSEAEIKKREKSAAEMKDIVLTTQQLDNLIGKYPLSPNFVITVTNEKNQLHIQATAQPKIPFTAISKSEFFNKMVQAKITFELDNTGRAISLTLHQAGQKTKGTKQEFN